MSDVLGFPATNCQYCHVDKLPKKGAPGAFNERRKWLHEEKDRRKPKEVDAASDPRRGTLAA